MIKKLAFLVLFGAFLLPYASATHIVGGEITYQCLGNSQYEITLTVYRDCYNGVPWFDNPAIVGVYDANWTLKSNLSLFLSTLDDTIPVVLTNPCLMVPPNVCVHRQSYTRIVSLPFSPGGYTFVYQRCCRNKLIRNIPDPLNTGITIIAEIGEDALTECNGGAVFNNWPPVAICVNQPIDFDHSATDPDGDSLVYRLCTPLNGPDSLNPAPNPPYPGPYLDVVWQDPPYNLSNVLGGVPLSIDANTGFMTGIPNTIGNFVVGVCVDEYRGGSVISTTRRDFQYNVADCGQPTAAFFTPEIFCDTLRVRFQNTSSGANFFRWYFDWGGDLSQTSVAFSPIYTFPDTGVYQIALIANPGDPCGDTLIQTIHLTETFVQAGLNLNLTDCDETGLTVQALDLSQDQIGGLSAWMWTLEGPNGIVDVSGEQNPEFHVSEEGDYNLQLVAFGANGCPDTAYLSFNAPIPTLDNLADVLTICQGDSVQLLPGANPDFSYQWSPATSLSNPSAPNPWAAPLENIDYHVLVSSAFCERNGTVSVIVAGAGDLLVSLDPDTIYLGESSQLMAELPGATGFSWYPSTGLNNPDIANPLATPEKTTTYTVVATLSSGCTVTGQVTVTVRSPFCGMPYIFFPTGFSPNGDGENDVLKLEGRYAEEVYWVVYSRWGEKLFEAHSIDDAWDGRYQGKEMPVESYGYYLRVRCQDGQLLEQKGNVTLLR